MRCVEKDLNPGLQTMVRTIARNVLKKNCQSVLFVENLCQIGWKMMLVISIAVKSVMIVRIEKCCVCGKPMSTWVEDTNGKRYCNKFCYEKTLPHCDFCKKPMTKWVSTKNGKKYCDEKCYQESLPNYCGGSCYL